MVKLKAVNKVYQSGNIALQALKDVSFTIKEGEIIVIGGVSGSGKSTLLHLLGAMDSPTSGEIWVGDEDITQYSSNLLYDFRARKIGFVFQGFNLIHTLNVFENVTVPMKLKGQKFDREEVEKLIDRVGLLSHIKHKPDELSGGQKQRVAIARALVHNPSYIIADEPTANLDSQTSKSIIDLMQELNKSFSVTVIIASHDPWILKTIKRKILMVDGRISHS